MKPSLRKFNRKNFNVNHLNEHYGDFFADDDPSKGLDPMQNMQTLNPNMRMMSDPQHCFPNPGL